MFFLGEPHFGSGMCRVFLTRISTWRNHLGRTMFCSGLWPRILYCPLGNHIILSIVREYLMPTIPITPLIAHVLLRQGGTLSSASATYPLSLFYHTRQCCQSLAKHVTSRILMPPVRIFLCQPPNIGRYISEVCCCHSNFFPCIYCCLCLSHSGVPSFLRLQL